MPVQRCGLCWYLHADLQLSVPCAGAMPVQPRQRGKRKRVFFHGSDEIAAFLGFSTRYAESRLIRSIYKQRDDLQIGFCLKKRLMCECL